MSSFKSNENIHKKDENLLCENKINLFQSVCNGLIPEVPEYLV